VSEAAVTLKAVQAQPRRLAGFVACEVALGVATAALYSRYQGEPGLVQAGAMGALAAGLATLLACHFSLGRGVNALLAAISVGFLLRTLLLGLGFVLSGARRAPFDFVLPFFLVYAATQAAEIVYVVLHNRGARAPGTSPQ
jgi:hypothetical protein